MLNFCCHNYDLRLFNTVVAVALSVVVAVAAAINVPVAVVAVGKNVVDSCKLFSVLIASPHDYGWLPATFVRFVYQFMQFDWSKMKNL